PFRPGMNSGTNPDATSPIPVPNAAPPNNTAPATDPGPGTVPPQARSAPAKPKSQPKDAGVLKAKFQVPDAAPDTVPRDDPTRRDQGNQVPAIVDPKTGLSRERYKAMGSEELGAVGAVQVDVLGFDQAEAAGLPPGSRPYVINPAQAMTLA